jgi:hypothetical protein
MTLLVVDESGMSTVEYSIVELYTRKSRSPPRLRVRRRIEKLSLVKRLHHRREVAESTFDPAPS